MKITIFTVQSWITTNEFIDVKVDDILATYKHTSANPTTVQQVINEQYTVPRGPTANAENTAPAVIEQQKTLFLMPEFALPTWEEPHGPGQTGELKFEEAATMHPFWAVKRLT